MTLLTWQEGELMENRQTMCMLIVWYEGDVLYLLIFILFALCMHVTYAYTHHTDTYTPPTDS